MSNNARRFKKEARTSQQDKKPSFQESNWDFNWFHPRGDQQFIVESMDEKEMTIVSAPSGCGKTSVVVWKALKDYAEGRYNQIWFIKTPVENGDDKLGFLTGSFDDKLLVHVETTKSIFTQFMSPQKLENDINNKNIIFTIPNFLQGRTIDNSIIIIDEAQQMSPLTLKLCMERAGKDSHVVVIGDNKQTYAVSKRPNGFEDWVNRVTYRIGTALVPKHGDRLGYIKLSSRDNMRSDLSKYVTEMYDE